MPVEMVVPLFGGAESLVIEMAANTRAFEPIAAIELAKFLPFGLGKRTRMHIFEYLSDLACDLP
jgi:hypothetical protein